MKKDLSFQHWPFFLIFLVFNSLLAYGNFSPPVNLWIATLGLALPALVAFLVLKDDKTPAANPTPVPLTDPPPSLWVLFLALVLSAYFFRLQTLPVWPLPDECWESYFSLDLTQKWDWRMLWGETQGLPLFIWLYGFLFKFIPFSFMAMRLASTLVSLLTVAVALGLLRRFYPKSFSFLFAWMLALSFWPFSLSRVFMLQGVFLLLEILSLGLLFSFLRARDDGERLRNTIFLTLVTALAFYTALIGRPLLAVVALTLFFHCFVTSPGRKKYFFIFLLACGCLILPMVLAELAPGGLYYLRSKAGHGFNGSYLVALFWNGYGAAPYGPNWGGSFNSVLTSLIFTGTLEVFRRRRLGLAIWLLGALGMFLLPGVLSNELEIQRVLAVLPLLLWLAVYGLQALAGEVPQGKRWAMAGLLLIASSAMDFYHYTGPYQHFVGSKKTWFNPDYQTIYPILQSENDKGVRLGFMDLTSNYDDHTLETKIYSFNTLSRPMPDLQNTQEIAILANGNYEPFLKERFPQARWTWVVDKDLEKDGILLGLIPLDESTRPTLTRWLEAYRVLLSVKALYMYRQPGQDPKPVYDLLVSHSAPFGKDRFLQCLFWEQMGLYFDIQKNLPLAWVSYQNAIKMGYPAAHLYNEIGYLLYLKGSYGPAKDAFQMAFKAPVNRTYAEENLQKTMEKIP